MSIFGQIRLDEQSLMTMDNLRINHVQKNAKEQLPIAEKQKIPRFAPEKRKILHWSLALEFLESREV
jgi:hypothetical protein